MFKIQNNQIVLLTKVSLLPTPFCLLLNFPPMNEQSYKFCVYPSKKIKKKKNKICIL